MEEEDQSRNPRTSCLVIGGHSSVGRSLVLRLLQLGNWIVKIADSDPSPSPTHQNSLLYDAVSHGRASFFRLDLLDKSQLLQAIDGSSVVFVAETSDASPCDPYKSYMRIVQGAKNVVNACCECKVNRLIYNSSADVVFDGSHHIKRGDESMPYPLKFTDMLTEMKAQAEAIILSANTDDILTCALRPSNVFGPSDTHLVHAMVNRATSVWGKFILGSGDNLSDFTFVENVAHAHICAAEALTSQNVSVAGKAFFITNLEPRNYWGFVSRIYEGLGYQRPSIRIPPKIVNSMLPLVRWARNKLESETEVGDFLDSVLFAIESSLFTRTYNCSAATEHLKYSPVVPVEEGIALTVKSISHLAKKSIPSKEHQFSDFSKAEEFLGYGRVADILLWRDEMETFTCFLVTCGLFHWFILSGRTFISSIAALLLLATFLLIVISILPINIFQKFPLPVFTISEPTVRNMLDNVAFVWNEGVQIAKTLAQGEDWSLFVKAASVLYFLKLISISPAFLLGAVLVLAFTSFFIYEQYERELDRAYKVVLIVAKSLLTLLVRSLPPSIASSISVNDELGEK